MDVVYARRCDVRNCEFGTRSTTVEEVSTRQPNLSVVHNNGNHWQVEPASSSAQAAAVWPAASESRRGPPCRRRSAGVFKVRLLGVN